jgi:hypothetical protein
VPHQHTRAVVVCYERLRYIVVFRSADTVTSADAPRSQPKANGSRWGRQSCRSPGAVHSSDSPGSQLQLDLQITRGRREACWSADTVASAGAPQSQRQCNLILSGTICSERLRRRSKRRSTQCACQPLENVVTQTTITRRRRGHEGRDGVSTLLYLSLFLSPSLSLFLSPLFF